jgi:hypothetical protein
MKSSKLFVPLGLSLGAVAVLGSRFDLTECLQTAKKLQEENPGLGYFHVPAGADVRPNSTIVTLDGCMALCGDGWSPYPVADVQTAMATWVLPLILLIGNLSLGKCGVLSNLVEVAHLLGDPIDAIWSLLVKLDAARRNRVFFREIFECLESNDKTDAIKDFGTVFLAMTDFRRKEDEAVLEELQRVRRENVNAMETVRKAGRELSDIRINNTLLSALAIISYFVNIIHAYLTIHSEHQSPRVPTMAFRLLYYWLIPAIILSTAAGSWPSKDASHRVLTRLQDGLGCDFGLHPLQPWDGGNYSWLPDKHREIRKSRRHFWLWLAAFFSVGLSFVTAFVLSWLTPTVGLGCGCLVLSSYFGIWIVSFLYTAMATLFFTMRNPPRNRRMLWIIVGAKDIFLAVSMVLLLVAAFGGIYTYEESHANIRRANLVSRFLEQLPVLVCCLQSRSKWGIC